METRCELERRGSIGWDGMMGLAEVGFGFFEKVGLL
jgi:hypothetical protein